VAASAAAGTFKEELGACGPSTALRTCSRRSLPCSLPCLLLALANGLYFAQYAVSAANTPARRVGAAALTALNAALCCEAALFVVLSLSRAPASALAFLAVILVRASLLAAIGFIFVLTLRARRRSRR
jgi:hypothetical protein